MLGLVPPQILARGILLAVSGGGDSAALLLLLHRWVQEFAPDSRLEVASVDHGIRPESAHEMEVVENWARDLGLPFHGTHLFLGHGASEEQARNARQAFLEGIVANRGLGLIATGHTIEDQAETVIMRMVRGTGPRGLSGIRPYRHPYVRPLLALERRFLRNYLKSKGFSWIDDPSNLGVDYFRNRIRNEVMPLLERDNPRLSEAIYRMARNVAEEHDALMNLLGSLLEEEVIHFAGGLLVSRKFLESVPPGARHLVVIRLWKELSSGGELSRSHVSRVLGIHGPGSMNLPGGVYARIWPEHLFLGPPWRVPGFSVSVPGPGVPFETPWGTMLFEPCDSGEVHIASWPVTVRRVRPSEKISRKGSGRVAVKNLYRSVPGILRELLICVEEDRRGVVWVEGAGPAWPFEGTRYTIRALSDARQELFQRSGTDPRVVTQNPDTA